jgi:hypothetical protein
MNQLDPRLEQLASKYPRMWFVLLERIGKPCPTVEECLDWLSLHSPKHPAHFKLMCLAKVKVYHPEQEPHTGV